MNVATLGASIRSPVSKVTDIELKRDKKRWVGPALLAVGGGVGVARYLLNADGRDSKVEPYAKDTPLTWILGESLEVSVIVSLLSERHRPVSSADIARIAGVSEDTARDHLEELVSYGLAEKVDNRTSYKLNTDHEVVRHLIEMEDSLLNQWYTEYATKEQNES